MWALGIPKRRLALVLGVSVLTARGQTQTAHSPLPVEEALKFESLAPRTPIQLSPDGEWIAYTVRDPHRFPIPTFDQGFTGSGVFSEAVGTEVRITNTRTGETRRLTDGRVNSWAPVWSPDARYLAFYSDRAGVVQLWLWERSTGELRSASPAVLRPVWTWEVPRWTPDSRTVVVKLLPQGISVDSANRLGRLARPYTPDPDAPEGSTVRLFSSYEASLGHTARGVTEQALPEWMRWRYGGDLATVDVESGTVRRLTSGLVLAWWDVSPHGAWLAFTHATGVDRAIDETIRALAVVPVEGGEVVELSRRIQQDWGVAVSWSPDGRLLGYISEGEGAQGGLFVSDVRRRSTRRVSDARPGWADPYRGPLWSLNGKSLYFTSGGGLWEVGVGEGGSAQVVATVPDRTLRNVLAPRGDSRAWSSDGRSVVVRVSESGAGTQGFFRIDTRSGEVQELTQEAGRYGGPFTSDVALDGSTVALLFSDAQHAPDLWVAGPDMRRSGRLTRLNPQFDRYALGASRLIQWTTSDGRRLRGALVLPPSYRPGVRVALVVEVYGGSLGSDEVNRFDRTRQLLATRGYAVLVPDAPLQVGTPMRDLAESVLPGIDRCVELGIADPERLGVMGHSYGGYSTLALLVQTDRFKAAVASATQGNLIAMYGRMNPDGRLRTQWAERGQGRMGGTPWEVRDRYIENSPFFYLARITTPLLLLHGAEDGNTPAYMAEQIFVGLQRLGQKVVYARYEGEGHWWGTWALLNQTDYWKRLIRWFDEHL